MKRNSRKDSFVSEINYKKGNRTRLPLDGSFDLTYRCNLNCRHCWQRIPDHSHLPVEELNTEEVFKIINETRKMGCQKWYLSGGEPMVRSDFVEIFDYISNRSVTYSLNTNGTLITPKIARLMKRKGNKMVALYGASAQVHDHITRIPGSFETTLRGMAYLKEVQANFVVQLIPMKANIHEFPAMKKMAETLSPLWRIGATWLFLSSCGHPDINREILEQRLDPEIEVDDDHPVIFLSDRSGEKEQYGCLPSGRDNRLFASCINDRNEFHIDPYGQMSFCLFVKDPALRYDLRKGNFQEGWEEFLPAMADKIRGGREFEEGCGSCNLRSDCQWCPAYGYLEERRNSAPVTYLCEKAQARRKYKKNIEKNHRVYFRVGDITVRIDSDLPITEETFGSLTKPFRVGGPGDDNVHITHFFTLPDLELKNLGQEYYRQPPWAIYKKGDSWIYLGIGPDRADPHVNMVALFNHDHSEVKVYSKLKDYFLKGQLDSLTLFPSDHILLAKLLADREGCVFHASGVILNGRGFLFVGHSEAGKSTMVKLLKDKAEILCDERIIVRRQPPGFRIYGTWSHGEVPLVSASHAPLKAILFLEKSKGNRLKTFKNKKEIATRLIGCVIKPLETSDWWEKTLSLFDRLIREVPCYRLFFDKSGKVLELFNDL